MFQLKTGSYRSLEAALLTDLANLKKVDPLAPILVTSPSGRYLRWLERQYASRGHLNIHWVPFYGLANRLVAGQAVPSGQFVREPALYVEAIRSLLQGTANVPFQLRDELVRHGVVPHGLPEALAGTLRDLRDSGARVVDVLKVAVEGFLGDPQDAPTLELYARLYELLQSNGLRTSADLLRRAGDAALRDRWLASCKAVLVCGVYDVTGVQLDFLLSLSGHSKASLYLPYIAGDRDWAFASRLVDDPGLSRKTSRKIAVPVVNPPDVQAEAWSCSGATAEVWWCAKKILALTEAGVPFEDIAVTARTLQPYSSLIQDTFMRHAIPFVLETREAIGAWPLAKTLRRLLTLDRDDYPLDAVFDVIKSPYFVSPISEMHPFIWQRIARLAGITQGWESWQTRLEEWARKPVSEEILDVLGESRDPALLTTYARQLLSVLTSLREGLKDDGLPHLWSEHAAWALDVFTNRLRLPGGSPLSESALWRALTDGIASLSAIDALQQPVTREDFLRRLESQLDGLELPLSPQNLRGVRVLDVMAARGRRFRSLIVLGLNEKSFPRLIREDPFLSDESRSKLSEAIGCRLSRKLDGYSEEHLLFAATMQMADETLVLLCQRSDEEGKALVPSLYLQEWLQAQGIPLQRLERALMSRWNSIPLENLTPKELSILMNRRHLETDRLHTALGWPAKLHHTLQGVQRSLDHFQPAIGPRDGSIGGSELLTETLRRPLSAQRLKYLSQCPFRFFGEYVLRLQTEREAVARDPSQDSVGKLMHRVLELHYRQGLPVETAVEQTFDAFAETAANAYPVAWEAIRRQVHQRADDFLRWDSQELALSGFRPADFEAVVEGPIPQLLGERFTFQGRIDRIDVSATGKDCRVVDYKTGRLRSNRDSVENRIAKGYLWQLPIYLGLAEAWLRRQGRTPAQIEAVLYDLRGLEAGKDADRITGDYWNSEGLELSETVQKLVSLVENGRFYIRPSQERGYCNGCALSTVCRKNHRPSAWRAEHEPLRQDLDARLRS